MSRTLRSFIKYVVIIVVTTPLAIVTVGSLRASFTADESKPEPTPVYKAEDKWFRANQTVMAGLERVAPYGSDVRDQTAGLLFEADAKESDLVKPRVGEQNSTPSLDAAKSVLKVRIYWLTFSTIAATLSEGPSDGMTPRQAATELLDQLDALRTGIKGDSSLSEGERNKLYEPIGELEALVEKDQTFWVAVETARGSFEDEEFATAVETLDTVKLDARTDNAKQQWMNLRWKSKFHEHASPAGEAFAKLEGYDRAYRALLTTSREAAHLKANRSDATPPETSDDTPVVDLAGAQEMYAGQLTEMQALLDAANTAFDEYAMKLTEQFETDKKKFAAAKALLPSLKIAPPAEADYEVPDNENQLNQTLRVGLTKVDARQALLAYERTHQLDFATGDQEKWVTRIEEAKKLVAMYAKTDNKIATVLAAELETWLNPASLKDRTIQFDKEITLWIDGEAKKRRVAVEAQQKAVAKAKKDGLKVNAIALAILAQEQKFLNDLQTALVQAKTDKQAYPRGVFHEVRLKGAIKPTAWLRGLFLLRDPVKGRYDFFAYPLGDVPTKVRTLKKDEFAAETADHRPLLCFDLLKDYSAALQDLKSADAWKQQAGWTAFSGVVERCHVDLTDYKDSGGLAHGSDAEKGLSFESDAMKANVVKENWESINQVIDAAKAIERGDAAKAD